MSTLNRLAARNLDQFDPKCPSESKWYACPESSGSDFVGCCASDPCSSKSGCSQGNIRPTSFNASLHGTPDFPPDASCATGSDFYTCVAGEPNSATVKTFWGCCKSLPCGENPECPAGELVAAYMGSPSQVQAYTGNSTSPSPSPSPSPSAEPSSGKSNTRVIAGAAVGGAVAIALIAAVLIFVLCRRKKAKSTKNTTVTRDAPPTVSPPRTAVSSNRSVSDVRSSIYKGANNKRDEVPPTYSSPDPSAPPNMLSAMAGYKHQQGDHQMQELPAELWSPPSSTQRYSELPADSVEAKIAELESPDTSPRPPNGYFQDAISPHRAELGGPSVVPPVRQPSPRNVL